MGDIIRDMRISILLVTTHQVNMEEVFMIYQYLMMIQDFMVVTTNLNQKNWFDTSFNPDAFGPPWDRTLNLFPMPPLKDLFYLLHKKH